MPELRLEIPGIPPSVGHYNRQAVINGRVAFFPTKEAKEWKRTVALMASGRMLRAREYTVSYVVFLPDRRRRDIDNFGKCILDSLTAAGVIDDDSGVTEMHAYKRMDHNHPRTVIIVRTEQEGLFGGAQ